MKIRKSEEEEEMVGMVEGREVDSEEEEVDDGDTEEEEIEDGDKSDEKGMVKEEEKQIKGNIIKLNEKYVSQHEDDQKKKVRILSKAAKARSKKWGSYKIEDVDMG